jgi:pimeloyl-ACP methyl ester carboxylesterase
MRTARRLILGGLTLVLVAATGYTAYVGYEASRQAVSVDENRSHACGTPSSMLGWSYEAINYDLATDQQLIADNVDPLDCTSPGAPAGDAVVTSDGVRIAGWYVPAASGIGPTGPTVILVHGYAANKSGILRHGMGLHQDFNLVVFDLRNSGQSGGTATTYGMLEQNDLRAVIDWLAANKHPAHVGVLGNSLGAATAINEARTDDRVDALVLDSMHTRLQYQFEQRLRHAGHPAYPGTWATFAGAWVRTGLWLWQADAVDAIPDLVGRPVLLTHGTADSEDLPERTQQFADDALAAGVGVELHWCQGAPHGEVQAICPADFAAWTHDFFTRELAS